MRLLLDSHALIWWLAEDPKLHPDAVAAITSPANSVAVSAASVWELTIKEAAGRIKLPDDLVDQIAEEGFASLPITFEHGRAAATLPRHHSDLVDRMLVAQAQLEGLTIVTRDAEIDKYGVATLTA